MNAWASIPVTVPQPRDEALKSINEIVVGIIYIDRYRDNDEEEGKFYCEYRKAFSLEPGDVLEVHFSVKGFNARRALNYQREIDVAQGRMHRHALKIPGTNEGGSVQGVIAILEKYRQQIVFEHACEGLYIRVLTRTKAADRVSPEANAEPMVIEYRLP